MSSSIAIVHSRAGIGVDSPSVTVETHLSGGLPSLSIVGLPETVVRESRERVRSAIINSGFRFPTRRITINLAPADLPKQGSRFDLPIAISILCASQQVPNRLLPTLEFLGELALSGALRRVRGVLPAALTSAASNRALILPAPNAAEAALSVKATILPALDLPQVCAHLHQRSELSRQPRTSIDSSSNVDVPDLSEVRGQLVAKRALEIAAAGGHNLLMNGPPGAGKTMLASCLPGLLPPLDESEALEVAAIHSLLDSESRSSGWHLPPFRSPHHGSSDVALVGGGADVKPGEVSLAHRGVLFLDEFPEFRRSTLEALREPLEAGRITIARARHRVAYPSRFQLLAAMNPCPCGYAGSRHASCRCTPAQIARYRDRISGPLLDRIDMQLELDRIEPNFTAGTFEAESSIAVAERVHRARRRQKRRGALNAELHPRQLDVLCPLDPSRRKLLQAAVKRLRLSMRGYVRLLRLTRTIADLEEAEMPNESHLHEAISYRLSVTDATTESAA